AAGAGKDLYSGIVDAGIVATRQEAKIGVLGALYGGTTGDSGRVVPRLRRTFPDAMALVDGAAATGERGGTVTTWLGRSSPARSAAGAGKDLYSGIVDAGIVATRQEAKIGVLGALYGGTTGDSGRVVPRLRRTFPDAMALVDGAAATGERGGTVTTWLGRSSPAVEDSWT